MNQPHPQQLRLPRISWSCYSKQGHVAALGFLLLLAACSEAVGASSSTTTSGRSNGGFLIGAGRNIRFDNSLFSTPSSFHNHRINNNKGLHHLSSSATTLRQLLNKNNFANLRGGALNSQDESDEDFEEEYSSDDEEDGDDEDLFGSMDGQAFNAAEDEFAEENHVDHILEAWKRTPPLTKMYLSASFAATAYGYLLNKNEFPPILELQWEPVLKRIQLWRPLTAFLNFGPFGLGYVMTAHFVWTYMSTLERLHHANPYDFWIMILFGQLCMVIGYPILKLSPKFLGHNFSTFLVYIWSRFHEGMEVNMFELFNSRAELLPWFFLAQTFLLEGEPPVLDFLGIVFGHVYHHFKTIGLLRAPPPLVAWYKGDSALAKDLRKKYRIITQDFEML